jgi:hypothetical protein
MSKPHPTASIGPSLADIEQALLAAEQLPTVRRRDLRSAVARVAALLGRADHRVLEARKEQYRIVRRGRQQEDPRQFIYPVRRDDKFSGTLRVSEGLLD